jgi:hypothetical protein
LGVKAAEVDLGVVQKAGSSIIRVGGEKVFELSGHGGVTGVALIEFVGSGAHRVESEAGFEFQITVMTVVDFEIIRAEAA